tara:strand:- start:2244 stop:2684 length:441 start_codon:yes stop_codon:yes gene_type:complete
MKLSVHWKDKINTREQMNRVQKGLAPKGGLGRYRVKWDHPDWAKGEKVEEKIFSDLDKAKEYGAWVARNYDLRREGITADSPGIKNGYNPVPEPSSVVPVTIETPFGLYELTEIDVFKEDAGQWTLVDALVKEGSIKKVEDNFRAG